MAPTADGAPATVLSWSGGKDAAYALLEMGRASAGDAVGDEDDAGDANTDGAVVELLTTVSADTGRSSSHGVRRELYERQAEAIGLPIRFVELPEDASNEEYEERMAEATADYARRGVERIAFADLHLEDVRAYREDRLADSPVAGHWPVWGRDTTAVAREIADAFEATAVAVDADALDESFAGRQFDADFLAALPEDVDPCGENGEFHTFVTDGPPFDEPVAVELGERTTESGAHGGTTIYYRDLRSAD